MSFLAAASKSSEAPIHDIVNRLGISSAEGWLYPSPLSGKRQPSRSEESGSYAAPRQRRDAIMRRFHEAVSGCVGEEPAMTALCFSIGVPQRTLNLCCRETLGMSAKSYLVLRRMYSAEMELRVTYGKDITVTEIATRFGFWNLGRFSAQYRRLFGETPSQTLQHAKDRRLAAAHHVVSFIGGETLGCGAAEMRT
jgi:AraC-like DNA-binding protein